jgi:hypothetical protein
VAQDVAGTLACNTGPNGNDAGNFCSNQGVDAGYIVAVNIEHALGDHGGSNAASVKLRDVAEPLTRSEHKGKTLVLVAFANRTRDGVKLPEIMPGGLAPALTNSGDGGRTDAINVVVGYESGPGYWMLGEKASALRAEGENRPSRPSHVIAFSSKDHGGDALIDIIPTLRSMNNVESSANGGGQVAVCIPIQEVGKRTGPSSTGDVRAGIGLGENGDPMFTLQAGAQHGVASTPDAAPTLQEMCVRRLTPRECERLQGFPDDYTEIVFRGKLAADGPRYKALGNSMAVPVMRWIGARIIANSER